MNITVRERDAGFVVVLVLLLAVALVEFVSTGVGVAWMMFVMLVSAYCGVRGRTPI